MPTHHQGEGLPPTAERADAGTAPHVAAVTSLRAFKARKDEDLARAAEQELTELAYGHVETQEERVLVRIDNELTPAAARALAIRMLEAADEIEGVGPGLFGYDPKDTEALHKLREAIDEELPIPDKQALEGDYVDQVRSAGRTLRRQIARAMKLNREAKRDA
jgi:hypothetical protein